MIFYLSVYVFTDKFMYLFQKLYIYQPEWKSREGIYENITEFLRFENKYDSIDHMIPNISTKIKTN